MRQIRQGGKVGLLMLCALCALALMVFLIMSRRGVPLAEQPQQATQPQHSQEPPRAPQAQPSLEPQQVPQPPPPPQQQQVMQSPPSQEPPQVQEPPQPQQAHARAVTDVRATATLLEEYKSRTGAYPTTAEGLGVLGAARKDAWGNDYIYQSPSTRNREAYDLFSAGPDRQPDTPDDDWGEMEEPRE